MTGKEWRPVSFVDTEPGILTAEEADATRGDQRKALYEFLRHIATLDSGALVLMATLIDKVFTQPTQRHAVGIAMVAFLASLMAGGIAYIVLLAHHPRVGAQRISSSDRRIALGAVSVTFACFFVGMAEVAWFFAANWFRW